MEKASTLAQDRKCTRYRVTEEWASCNGSLPVVYLLLYGRYGQTRNPAPKLLSGDPRYYGHIHEVVVHLGLTST